MRSRCWSSCWWCIAFGLVIDPGLVRRAAGLVLLGWAAWHALYGHRHRVRFGMTTGMAGLAAWSFLMATAHGAGLMLIPLLAPLGAVVRHPAWSPARSALALAAVAIHSLAMLATTAAVALLVYEWVGVGDPPPGLGQSRPGLDGGVGGGGGVAAGLARPRKT